jgi:hypothetical protein
LALEYLEYDSQKTLSSAAFLEMLKDADGKTFEGYKGGDYTMSRQTPVWVSNYGTSNETAVVGVIDKNYVVIIATAYQEY